MVRRSEPDEGCDVGEVEVWAKTDKAVLCIIEGTEEWIPFSQLHESSAITRDSLRGESGNLVISSWLAREKGYV